MAEARKPWSDFGTFLRGISLFGCVMATFFIAARRGGSLRCSSLAGPREVGLRTDPRLAHPSARR
jgi:hypothetical protein